MKAQLLYKPSVTPNISGYDIEEWLFTLPPTFIRVVCHVEDSEVEETIKRLAAIAMIEEKRKFASDMEKFLVRYREIGE